MKNKHAYLRISKSTHRILKAACLLAEVSLADCVEWAAVEAVVKLREGWRPPHTERDTTTQYQEAAE